MRNAVAVAVFVLVSAAGPFSGAQGMDDPYLLWEQSVIYRDEWGTPHVYADNRRALGFAFGWAQAEDHLEAMLTAYRVANGRAAEVFGERYAASDEFAIKMGHADLAREFLPTADAATRDLCEGFALGVNAWLVEHPDRAPPWAEGVRPEDILALLHCYLMSFAPLDLPEPYGRAAAAFTGNAWAVGPSRSATGEAMLVINPHTFYEGPFGWYEAHLVCQDLNVAGATLFGLPVILQGHNGFLGWALTPNQADFADVYLERMPQIPAEGNPKQIQQLLVPEEHLQYLAYLRNTKTYYVRTGEGLAPRPVLTLLTGRGPVIGQEGNFLFSYRIGGYYDLGGIAQFDAMGRARNLTEFRAALRMGQIPCFHVVYADRDGNIFYLYNAAVHDKTLLEPGQPAPDAGGPVGGARIDWSAPVPGDDPVYAWGDRVGLESLPFVLNPSAGYVQACGNPPWSVAAGVRIAEDQWPPWFVNDRDTYRAKRVRQLIESGVRSFRDCQSMLFDVLAPAAYEAVPHLLRFAESNPKLVDQAHPDLAVGLEILRDWDYVAETGSVGMTFFRVWWAALQSRYGGGVPSVDAMAAAMDGSAPDVAQAALAAAAEAARSMRNEFETVFVPWGEVHTIRRGHQEVGLPGAVTGGPVFVASDNDYDSGRWVVDYGYGFAMVVKFGDRPEAVSLVPFGASEHPGSPHFADQLELLAGRRFKLTRFEHEDVQAHAAAAVGRVVTLRPSSAEAVATLRAERPIEARLMETLSMPAPAPLGLGAFTACITPEAAPAEVPRASYIDFYVSPATCTLDNLSTLAVWAYRPGTGWEMLPVQEADYLTRTFRAVDSGVGSYVVLGPSEHRLAAPVLARRVPLFEPAPVPRPERDVTATPPVPSVSEEPAEPQPALPAGRPTTPPAENLPAPDRPVRAPEVEDTLEARMKAMRERSGPAPMMRLEPPAIEPRKPVRETGPAEAALPETPPEAVIAGAAGPAPADSSFQAIERASSSGLQEPLPNERFALATGREIQLRPRGMEGLVHISAREFMGAGLRVVETPPGPLPDGLAAFTKFVIIVRSSSRVRAEAAIRLQVEARACAAEDLDRLKLYAYDAREGWTALPNQTLSRETRTFSAIDDALRIYAILGPAACLRE